MKMPHTPSSERATTRKPETAPPRIATWTASTRLRRAAEAVRTLALTLMNMPMIPEAIEHGRTDDEGECRHDPDRDAGQAGHVGDIRGLDPGDQDADQDRRDDGEHRDGGVLALHERHRALVDGAGDRLHLGRPGVARQHVAGQVEREQDRGEAGDRDDPVVER